MKRVVVRYKVHADRVEEHEAKVRAVFAALALERPVGLSYQALKLGDGASFVHVATISTADGTNPLTELPAFRAFTAGIADRCEELPTSSPATAVGAYEDARPNGPDTVV